MEGEIAKKDRYTWIWIQTNNAQIAVLSMHFYVGLRVDRLKNNDGPSLLVILLASICGLVCWARHVPCSADMPASPSPAYQNSWQTP